ncbi:carbohydrate ABC transporter permease [Alicyclobacillus fastidiosus]|uniref:Carbohydrate ABC transporter permease n=1 Tax=Alicyclobacillus fastidiosus TaxID=392011 RepID=A0ABV5ABC3_9BACL|nr:carbohydrate ABC transporter permease [Alicyclobacillus fastidiosus]WEH10529.1 carbohydrate ABC transporter permease [Alicyclobacillus fastidiosus]
MSNSLARQRSYWNKVRFVGIVIFAIAILLPLAYVILVSLTPDTEVGGGAILPTHIAWNNYVMMWSTVHLARDIVNSVIIAGLTGVCSTIVALGAAYVVSRFRFKGRKPFMFSLISMQTIPQVMMLLPLFVIIVIIQNVLNVHLVGQYYTIIITYMTFALPFACWLLLSYMANIPVELEEAAQMDGCTRAQVVYHVVLPLILPGLVVTFVFSFLLGWSDVLFASVLTTPSTQTVAVGLQAYMSSSDAGGAVYWGQLMAASLTSGVPIVVIFLFFQKYIIGGLANGAVKG